MCLALIHNFLIFVNIHDGLFICVYILQDKAKLLRNKFTKVAFDKTESLVLCDITQWKFIGLNNQKLCYIAVMLKCLYEFR